MSKDKKSIIGVQGTAITILSQREDDFISLTDMSKKFGDDTLIYSWMRNRNTLEFLGIWEQIHNPAFKGGDFKTFKKEAGPNSFHLTPKKWIDATQAIGIQSRAGRYGGGTYAHKDLAFEFGSWLSPEFKLYLIKEFQRLKDDESRSLSLDWNLSRSLSKLNYRIHTDAIRAHLIPAAITPEQARFTYARQADVLNMALFGQTAKQWRDAHSDEKGNMRDDADVTQRLVLANLESLNAEFIHMGYHSRRACKSSTRTPSASCKASRRILQRALWASGWTKGHWMKSEFATYFIAACARSTGARGRFGINFDWQGPLGRVLAATLQAGTV